MRIKMKKIISIILCIVTVAAACLSLASCDVMKNGNPIDFGEKYVLYPNDPDNYASYVFNADHTGYMDRYYKYLDIDENDKIHSGRIEFVWEEASDGAVYLFETDVQYNDDNSEGATITLINYPIYFSEDFFTYFNSKQSVKYIKEGSKLEKQIID